MLTINQQIREAYHRDGFAVLPGFVSAPWRERLKSRAASIVADFDPEDAGIFTTRDQARHSDAWFLESATSVRCFLEEEARGEGGVLAVDKDRSVNKIGHSLHALDPDFKAWSQQAELERLAADLGHREPRAIQSMYIFKPPRIGGKVDWHQDATFLYTDPVTVVGFWIALDDATVENGCLWAIPGGHLGPLRKRFRRVGSGNELTMDTLDASPLDTNAAVPLEVEAGTLVLLHGLLPHGSEANRSDRTREAYSVHVIDRGAAYPEDNWLRWTG